MDIAFPFLVSISGAIMVVLGLRLWTVHAKTKARDAKARAVADAARWADSLPPTRTEKVTMVGRDGRQRNIPTMHREEALSRGFTDESLADQAQH